MTHCPEGAALKCGICMCTSEAEIEVRQRGLTMAQQVKVLASKTDYLRTFPGGMIPPNCTLTSTCMTGHTGALFPQINAIKKK